MDIGKSHFLLDLYHGAQSQSALEFSHFAFSGLQKIIPFESAGNVLMHAGDNGQIVITGQATFNVMPNKVALREELLGLECFSLQDGLSSADPLLSKSMALPNRSHTLCARKDACSANLYEYARRSGALNSLNLVSRKSESTISSFSLWRSKLSDSFQPQDIHLANQLIPHALLAFAINHRLASHALFGGNQHMGMIIAETGRLIHHLDDVAIFLLRREFPDWLSRYLPVEVLLGFQRSSTLRFVGRHVIMSLRRQGSLLLISIQAREPGRKLTSAELRVVESIVLHGSYKEAARHLMVSPSTVRNQLHAIYDKLGIKGKSELLKVFSDIH